MLWHSANGGGGGSGVGGGGGNGQAGQNGGAEAGKGGRAQAGWASSELSSACILTAYCITICGGGGRQDGRSKGVFSLSNLLVAFLTSGLNRFTGMRTCHPFRPSQTTVMQRHFLTAAAASHAFHADAYTPLRYGRTPGDKTR